MTTTEKKPAAKKKAVITGPLALLAARFELSACLYDGTRGDFLQSCLTHIAEMAVEHPEILISSDDDDFDWKPSDSYMARYQPYNVKDGTLAIPVKGSLLNGFDYSIDGYATGYQYIEAAWKRGQKDSNVQRVALIVDSNGGQAAGNFELIEEMNATQEKPCTTFVSGNAYSGGYSIATVGDEIVAAPAAGVGSIGVVTAHVDLSKAMEQEGVKVTFIFAGKHKVDGNPYEPLPKSVKDRIQASVDETYGVFCSTVAKNRGMEVADVKATEADTFSAAEGVENGLVDRVQPTRAAVSAFAKGPASSTKVETMTDVKQADHDKAVSDSKAEGKKAERQRIASILGCDEAKDKQKLATELAYGDEELSLAACQRILKAASPEKVEAAAPAGQQQQQANQEAFDKAMGNGTGVKATATGDDKGGEAKELTPDQQAKSIMGDFMVQGGGALRGITIDAERLK